MKRVYALLKDADGSISIMMVILMFVFVGLLAFVIDLAHLQTVKNELQNAGDACALRGARAFVPDNIPTTGYEGDPDPVNAKKEAYNNIKWNKSDNKNFKVGDVSMDDIQPGIWNYETRDWVPGTLGWPPSTWPPDPSLWGHYIGPGITLPARRNGSNSLGPVAMTLAKLFGINTVNVSATAIAALSGPSELTPSYPGSFPIAVNQDLLTSPDATIFLSPDTTDVGGWTSMDSGNVNAAVLKKLINGSTPNPDVTMGETISLLNGSACSVVKEAIKVYPATENPKGVYALTTPVEITFPVVTAYKFNQSAEVAGFMAATITYFIDSNAKPGTPIPNTSPPQVTDGHCDIIIRPKKDSAGNLPGGGRWYGLLATQPKLVQ
jgi:hypothetical protein